MTSTRTFFRSVPIELTREFLTRHDQRLVDEIDWQSPPSVILKNLNNAFKSRPDLLGGMQDLVERISALADEPGEAAMRGVTHDRAVLEAMSGNSERALSMFLYDPERFQLAEEVRYTDEKRRGKIWSGFEGPKGRPLKVPKAAVDSFKAALRKKFDWGKVHVEAFERSRLATEKEYRLLQINIYREGWPNLVREFVGEDLQEISRRPVYEAAVTYEPDSGSIEVVSRETELRTQVALLFCLSILDDLALGGSLPLRRYDLNALKQPFSFPSDAEDQIESVRVWLLRLMPTDTNHQRIVLENLSRSPVTIWDMADRRFGDRNPLRGQWIVTQAKLTISFQPRPGFARTLPITITMPHGCDLKDRTTQELLVAQKYLPRWGLLRNVAGA